MLFVGNSWRRRRGDDRRVIKAVMECFSLTRWSKSDTSAHTRFAANPLCSGKGMCPCLGGRFSLISSRLQTHFYAYLGSPSIIQIAFKKPLKYFIKYKKFLEAEYSSGPQKYISTPYLKEVLKKVRTNTTNSPDFFADSQSCLLKP
jgi:hypothetical protein